MACNGAGGGPSHASPFPALGLLHLTALPKPQGLDLPDFVKAVLPLQPPPAHASHCEPEASLLHSRVAEEKQKLKPAVSFSTLRPLPGETVALHIQVPPSPTLLDGLRAALLRRIRGSAVRVTVAVNGSAVRIATFPVESTARTWRANIPTTAADRRQHVPVKVEIHDGRHSPLLTNLQVKDYAFPYERLWLPASKSRLQYSAVEKLAISRLVATASWQRYWQGPFSMPCTGPITTGYGVGRSYNGKHDEQYFHEGIDLGGAAGSAVRAPAAGRIAFVGREGDGFAVNGNCVGLDHGQGLTSMLMHMEAVHARPGDTVSKGDVLGTVGTTGRSTGPHLHWGLYSNGRCVNPVFWSASSCLAQDTNIASDSKQPVWTW